MKKDIKALLSEVEKKIVAKVHEKPSQFKFVRTGLMSLWTKYRNMSKNHHPYR